MLQGVFCAVIIVESPSALSVESSGSWLVGKPAFVQAFLFGEDYGCSPPVLHVRCAGFFSVYVDLVTTGGKFECGGVRDFAFLRVGVDVYGTNVLRGECWG